MIENRDITRRELVKVASVAGVCLAAAGTFSVAAGPAFGQDKTPDTENGDLSSRQYGFLMYVDKCVQCGNCALACRNYNNTADEDIGRRKISKYETKDGSEVFVSTSCMHCENPSCMTVCPSGAISKGAGGVVTVDQKLCIGCKYCHQACPFAVPQYNAKGMDKCDCCLKADVALGDSPHCVDACRFGALYYGTTDELKEISHGKAQRIPGPTKPSGYLM